MSLAGNCGRCAHVERNAHLPRLTLRSSTFGRASNTRLDIRCAATVLPPSSRAAASELQALSRLSKIVPDTLLFEESSSVRPQAATVSFGLVRGAISGERLGMKPFENAVASALNWDGCKQLPAGDERLGCQLDKAFVNVGALLAPQVAGRVATEVDPRLANDTGAIVSRVQHLMSLYREVGVPPSKLIFRVPATWAAIQAAKQLEDQGIAMQVFMVFSLVQGVAAAQAGVSVVQPNVGRVRDWYRKNPGRMRNPQGPREDSGVPSSLDMGVALASDIYNYAKQYHSKTQVMASGLRTKDDALALAGCDYLVMADKVLKALDGTLTTQGYNDGFSAVEATLGLDAVLTPQAAAASNIQQLGPVTEAEFNQRLADGAGGELLQGGLKDLLEDVDSVLPYFRNTYAIGRD